MPKVSVLVPNYNHAQFLRQRINSIFNQTFQDFEVILLDDCSTDNSAELLKEYEKHPKVSHLVFNNKNSGSTLKQLQRAIELSSGEYIWIAESDDWAQNDFLEKALSKVNINIGIIYSQSYIVNENNERLYLNTKYTDYLDKTKWIHDFEEDGLMIMNSFFIYRNIIPNMSATLIAKDDLLKVELNDKLKYLGDWFIYCQLLLKKRICYISEPLNNYRQHSNTVRTKAMINGLKEKEYFFLLAFLKKHKNISRKGLNKQFYVNLKSWLKNFRRINILRHFQIFWQAIKYFV
jgi:glycosyltransferase involved in cell wall biosynthesis